MQDLPFDPTYGYTLDTLLEVESPPPPSDFGEFWGNSYQQACEIPLRLSKREIPSPDSGFRLFELEYDSLDRVRIGGWLVVPSQRKPVRGVVIGHGYGGREAPEFGLPFPDAALLFPCARGFHRSAHQQIPATADQHVLHGIESRDTYVHRGCVADYWLAASALLELHPELASNLVYYGASFAGGIGALALPWDRRISCAFLDAPSFGNHPLRVTLDCVGSGRSVREYYLNNHPEVLEVLRYYDAGTAARFIDIPVFIAAALFDPAVPPPGQFSVYNAIPGKKKLYPRQAAHVDDDFVAEETRAIHRELSTWLDHL